MTTLLRALYRIKNWKSYYRALVHGTAVVAERVALAPVGMQFGAVSYRASLSVKVIRAKQNRPTGWFRLLFWAAELDLGTICRRVVTTAGVRYLCDTFNADAGGADVNLFKYHAMGTGAGAEDPANTALGTEVETRTAGNQASATASPHATYTTVATITATAPRVITEHGIFSQLAVGGTLWDRSVFAVINLGTGDGITFTYVLTANSGG